jgi:hypothetical protein
MVPDGFSVGLWKKKEREREREKERDSEWRDREREREREREKETERKRERERERKYDNLRARLAIDQRMRLLINTKISLLPIPTHA